MGWTVYYKGKADSPINADEKQLLARHVEVWAPKLDEGCEPYAWGEKDGGKVIEGFTKVQSSANDQEDFVTVVRATQELEKLLPRFAFEVSDDYVITDPVKPSEAEPE